MLNRVTEAIVRERIGRPTARAYAWSWDGGVTEVSVADFPGVADSESVYGKTPINRVTMDIADADVEAWHEAHPDVCRECHNERRVLTRLSAAGAEWRPCGCTEARS